MGDGGQELKHERFDFGLQEWRGHDGEERLQVVLDKVHHDEHSVGVEGRQAGRQGGLKSNPVWDIRVFTGRTE